MYISKEESRKLMESLLYGREVLIGELPIESQVVTEQEMVQKRNAFIEKGSKWYCRRCEHIIDRTLTDHCQCEKSCAYCINCIQMGKVRRCSTFLSLPEPNYFTVSEPILKWEGTLSEQQACASKDIVQTIKNNEERLVWAVTGAGKTEMLFAGIAQAIKEKKRICLTSPRVDVCLELAPRIREAFPTVTLSVLYGDMEESYQYTQFVLATTHQLYRFKEAFDVMIIDEVDAFPFYMDRGLQFAVEKARKDQSAVLYLTATPDRKIQKKVRKKQLQATILPARYHGYPLPVPVARRSKFWRQRLLKNLYRESVFKQIKELLKKQKPFLIFVPEIQWMKQFEKNLRTYLSQAQFTSVYSSDPERKRKVQQLREEKLDFLLTTTILIAVQVY